MVTIFFYYSLDVNLQLRKFAMTPPCNRVLPPKVCDDTTLQQSTASESLRRHHPATE